MSAKTSKPAARKAVTVPGLRAMQAAGQKIVALTCYDYSFAAQIEAAGIDVVLVGDSLGMVVQGHASTLPVRVDDIVYHCAAVARGLRNTLLIADLPFMSYRDAAHALAAAGELMARGGAAMVKLEGGGWTGEIIHALAERDVPVCAHLGLTPQSVHKLGGYRMQGKHADAAAALQREAREVAAAGADLLVLESVPAALAARISSDSPIPVIGIGAGAECHGQVLVLYDLLGITPGKTPRFSKNFLAGRGDVGAALNAYAQAVREGEFPGAEHST